MSDSDLFQIAEELEQAYRHGKVVRQTVSNRQKCKEIRAAGYLRGGTAGNTCCDSTLVAGVVGGCELATNTTNGNAGAVIVRLGGFIKR